MGKLYQEGQEEQLMLDRITCGVYGAFMWCRKNEFPNGNTSLR